MQVILASAKIMKERVPSRGITPTEPLFQRQATMLAGELARMSGNRLSELFNCSAAIGRENRERFALFGTDMAEIMPADRKSTRLNSSHQIISYAVFCL